MRAMGQEETVMPGEQAAWRTAEHYRPRMGGGGGIRSWGTGVCIDKQCQDPSHYGVKKPPSLRRTEAQYPRSSRAKSG